MKEEVREKKNERRKIECPVSLPSLFNSPPPSPLPL